MPARGIVAFVLPVGMERTRLLRSIPASAVAGEGQLGGPDTGQNHDHGNNLSGNRFHEPYLPAPTSRTVTACTLPQRPTGASPTDVYPIPLDVEPAFGEQLDRLGKREALLLEDPRGQRVRRVVVLHGTGPLHDDRATVVLVRAEVHRASADLAAGGQHRFVHVMAPHALASEARQQRRVDIHHAILVSWRGPLTFERIFDGKPNRLVMVGVFLAMLELIRDKLIWAEQADSSSPIYVRALTDEPAEQAVRRAIMAVGEAENEQAEETTQEEQPPEVAHTPPIPIVEIPAKSNNAAEPGEEEELDLDEEELDLDDEDDDITLADDDFVLDEP